jgi:hypothetical protein
MVFVVLIKTLIRVTSEINNGKRSLQIRIFVACVALSVDSRYAER